MGPGSRSDPMSREINLLMVSEDGINHYTAIKSLSRLLSLVIPNISVNNIFT